MKQTILTKITNRMTELNIGKAELSQSVGIGRTSLWRYLKGEKEITLGTLIKICEKLDLKILVVIK